MALHCAKVASEVLVASCLCIQSCSGSFGGFVLRMQVVVRVLVAVTFGSEWVRTSENESGVSRDLASAYVLCLRTFVVPNLQRGEGMSLGK